MQQNPYGLTNTVDGEKNSNKKIWLAAIAGLLSAALAIGTSFAYLTASKTIDNKMTLDTNLKIDLAEPSFNESEYSSLVPLQKVSKDPTVTNIGTVNAYIAATVRIPVFSGTKLDSDNRKVVVNDGDLFEFASNSGWAQKGDAVVEDGYRIYTFVYEDELTADQSTSALFNELQVVNLTEDPSIDDASVKVSAYAIQSFGFDNAIEAYDAYLSQDIAAVVVDTDEAV